LDKVPGVIKALKEILKGLARTTVLTRAIPALLLFALSVRVFSSRLDAGLFAAPTVILGIALMVLGVVIVAPSIAHGLVERAFDFFTYSEKFDRPQPMYGKPMALRKNRQYEEAINAYEEIAEAYPDELKPWLEMIDVMQRDLGDPERAERIYQRALIEFQSKADRERLARQLSGLSLRS
jgi:tetratricopeptide (TPR) repeat protein